jgi:predicted amino acid-binding ACT domain protein
MDDCPLTPILSKNKQWIEDMKQTIISEVLEMSKLDRIAFSSLECEDTMQKIDIIDLSQFE